MAGKITPEQALHVARLSRFAAGSFVVLVAIIAFVFLGITFDFTLGGWSAVALVIALLVRYEYI